MIFQPCSLQAAPPLVVTSEALVSTCALVVTSEANRLSGAGENRLQRRLEAGRSEAAPVYERLS